MKKKNNTLKSLRSNQTLLHKVQQQQYDVFYHQLQFLHCHIFGSTSEHYVDKQSPQLDLLSVQHKQIAEDQRKTLFFLYAQKRQYE
ncbi:MAG: hypothetical protein AAGA27_03505 [Pseudomonadota bacterium]